MIGPHADDIEFGAGATVSRLNENGANIHFLIATDGAAGTKNKDDDPSVLKETRKYVKFLFFDENKKELSDDIKLNNVADLLEVVFNDVVGYDYFTYQKVEEIMNNGSKTLGEAFSTKFDEERGIELIFQNGAITKGHFIVYFFDEKFVVKSIDGSHELQDLEKPKYQQRYIKAMSEMFGPSYKRYYKKVINSQIKRLEEGLEYTK